MRKGDYLEILLIQGTVCLQLTGLHCLVILKKSRSLTQSQVNISLRGCVNSRF
uniref:Uncharacterized protein n=1 Tax=Anguilla anguilla TaxID=7936 RepID=A0A0E9W8H3_ANGAN